MFQNGQKVVVVASGDPTRVIKVQAASSLDTGRYPTVDTTGVTGRDQQVQIVSGGDESRFPKLQGLSSPFSPSDLSPAAWYKFNTGITQAGGFVSQWDDQSGNGRHLVQATGTNQPAVSAGIITFDGLDNWMRATFAQAQPLSIFLRMRQDTWSNNEYFYDGATVNQVLMRQRTATPQIGIFAGAIPANNSDLAVGAWGVVSCVFNGASSLLKVDSNAAAAVNAGTNAMDGLTVGGSGTPSNYCNWSVKEIVVVPSAVSGADLTNMIAYLGAI